MRLAVAFVVIVIQSMNANSYSLEGAWQSDRQKTLDWNSQNRKVEKKYLDKLATILGSQVIVYGDKRVCQFLTPQEYYYGNTKVPIHGMSLGNDTYEIIVENEHGFVVKQSFDDGTSAVSMLIFESDESFYGVALETEDFGQPGHREYYKRIELPNSINWGKEACYEP